MGVGVVVLFPIDVLPALVVEAVDEVPSGLEAQAELYDLDNRSAGRHHLWEVHLVLDPSPRPR